MFFDNLVVTMQPGALLEERHYYPYGLPIQGWGSKAAGSLTNRQRYQSNEYREEAGLNWMDFHNRQYDPQIGRFLGIDPLADDGGQQTLSPYLAMGANPACNVDPLGLQFATLQENVEGGLAMVGEMCEGEFVTLDGGAQSRWNRISQMVDESYNDAKEEAAKRTAAYAAEAAGNSKDQSGNVGSNSVSSNTTGADGENAAKVDGGTPSQDASGGGDGGCTGSFVFPFGPGFGTVDNVLAGVAWQQKSATEECCDAGNRQTKMGGGDPSNPLDAQQIMIDNSYQTKYGRDQLSLNQNGGYRTLINELNLVSQY